MAISQSCTAASSAGGKITIQFGKAGLEFNDQAHVNAWLSDILTPEVLRALLIAKWRQADPTFANPNLIVGHTITGDLAQNFNIVRVS